MTSRAFAAIDAPASTGSAAPGATRKDQLIYWATTGLVAAVMLWSAYNFSFNEEMKGAFAHLASDCSSWLTGVTLDIGGGRIAS